MTRKVTKEGGKAAAGTDEGIVDPAAALATAQEQLAAAQEQLDAQADALDTIADGLREAGLIVARKAEDLTGEQVQALLSTMDINLMCEALVERCDELTDVPHLAMELGIDRDGVEILCGGMDVELAKHAELDLQHPVVVQATMAATSRDWRESAHALKELRHELNRLGIFSRGILDLM